MNLKLDPKKEIKVNQAINLIIKDLYNFKIKETVDKVVIGNIKKPLKGIATTFLATSDVIKKANLKGINLIISHEPVFYNHNDEIEWLEQNRVYKFKSDLINKNEITIWRLHDYKHRKSPDPILKAITDRLKWNHYKDKNDERIFHLPGKKLKDILSEVKSRLNLNHVKLIGDKNLICKKLGILVGAQGGKKQIAFTEENDLDLLICGEINEWEISEYIIDANFAELKKSLIVIGHAESERDGMKFLAKRLKNIFPKHLVTYIEPSKKYSTTTV